MHRSILLLGGACRVRRSVLSDSAGPATPARAQAHVQDRYCLQGRAWELSRRLPVFQLPAMPGFGLGHECRLWTEPDPMPSRSRRRYRY